MKRPSSSFGNLAACGHQPEGAPLCGVTPADVPRAGLVSSKTSGTPPIEVSFDVGEVQRRRLGRLKRTVWACSNWHLLTVPKGHRERVWFVTLTYRRVGDWLPRHGASGKL